MGNKLQAAVCWAAEAAGETISNGDIQKSSVYAGGNLTTWHAVPGASGTLEGEVETVLAWLAKAGYLWRNGLRGADFVISDEFGDVLSEGNGDSIHAALESALVSLHAGAVVEPVCDCSHVPGVHRVSFGGCGIDDCACKFQPAESEPPDA